MEVILDGWLIKFTSDRCLFKKKRWNKYWFVLRHSAHNAGEVILEYYKDSDCHNLRGRIDLGECEQLDSGLLFGKKESVGHGFDIRTGNKIYYLVAETEVEMNKWVGCISTVCGLKLKAGDDYATATVNENGTEPLTSPPVALYTKDEVDTTTSTQTSSPYMFLSECFTGKPIPGWPNVDNCNYSYPKETGFNFPFPVSNYDYPKPNFSQDKQEVSLQDNFAHELYKVPPPPRIFKTANNKIYSYLESPSSEDNEEELTFEGVNLGNNIFLYNSGPAIYHENSDAEVVRKEALKLAQQLEKIGIIDSGESETNDFLQCPSSEHVNETQTPSKTIEYSADLCIPPPRPPKPQDLHREKVSHNVSDFPLSLRTTCTETNDFHSAVQRLDSNTDNSASQQDFKTIPILLDDIYDIPKPRSEDNLTILFKASNCLPKESFHIYDNAPPAFIKSPPAQEHEMSSDLYCEAEQSVEGNSKDADKCCDIPPLVNRNLKPKRTMIEKNDEKSSQARENPSEVGNYTTEVFCNQDKRNIDLDTTVERPLFCAMSEIQYLDLNLDDSGSESTSKLEESQAKRTTIYKTVDFVRTEAFNKTRQNVEELYRSSS